MSRSISQDPQELLKTALAELSSLNRVDHKLALTEASNLERVLSLLLSRLLSRIGSNHVNQTNLVQLDAISNNNTNDNSAAVSSTMEVLRDTYQKIHDKLVSMLSHIMKRVRADPGCQLPCDSILKLLLSVKTDGSNGSQTASSTPNNSVNPFTLNLTLAFLTLGVPRIKTVLELQQLLPGLLLLLETNSRTVTVSNATAIQSRQASQVAHLVLCVLERLVVMEPIPNNVTKTSSALSTNAIALDQVRTLLAKDASVAKSLFELLMDVLLYQTMVSTGATTTSTVSTMPSPGLSQFGYDRLRTGPSSVTTATLTSSTAQPKDWASEMAVKGSRLRDLKLAILLLIAPTRRWALFEGQTDQTEDTMTMNSRHYTLALLVASTGDGQDAVSDRANSYLKAYMDTFRTQTNTTMAVIGTDKEQEGGEKERTTPLDNPIPLMIDLLRLTLGDANAEPALAKLHGKHVIHQQELSMKRRMTSNKTTAGISLFCAKLIEDTPNLISSLLQQQLKSKVDQSSPNESILSLMIVLGTLAVQSSSKILSSISSGTTTLTTLQAGPSMASAQLLNALCVRWTAAIPTMMAMLAPNDVDKGPTTTMTNILDLCSEALATACTVVSMVSSARPTSSSIHRMTTSTTAGEGSIVVRDHCYGVICSLSRSTEFCESGRVFGSSFSSMETATLLFGCAAHEEETLRPRAVAALDALLGAYSRMYSQKQETNNPSTMSVVTEPVNPWSNVVTTTKAPVASVAQASSTSPTDALAKSLLSLLWGAAQSSKSKASRVAAARWSQELLMHLDKPNACHLLCCLAGDSDVTAAAIARQGLGLNQKVGEPYEATSSTESGIVLPDFTDIARVLFTESEKSMTSWRPRYHDFSYHGKAATLRFGLDCLLNDLYGGDEYALKMYMRAVCDTLRQFSTTKHGGRATLHGRESIDLLDECAISFSSCVAASQFARTLMVADQELNYTVEDLKFLTVHGASSKARRHLAEAIGHLLEDHTLWSRDSAASLDEWIEACQVDKSLAICAKKLHGIQNNMFAVGEVHGAAFLGATSIRAFRLFTAGSGCIVPSKQADLCWKHSTEILAALGKEVMNSDEVIGNAFSQSIAIAMSYRSVDSPVLDTRLYSGVTEVLVNLDKAVRRYANGDHTDPIRACSLIKATGAVLAASTSAAGIVSEGAQIGPARLQSVDAIFDAIGSMAFRKDPEVALLAGEALAAYADAYSPENAVWSTSPQEWPEEFDQDFMNNLPPHEQCIYGLLEREFNSSSPHKRTAVAPSLMAIVAHAAKIVNGDSKYASRALVVELVKNLPTVQNTFIRLLADPKSKQLSRESCCLGLAACQGLAAAVHPGQVDGEIITLKDSLNESLLKAFGQSTNYGGSAMMESRQQNMERLRQESRVDDVNGSSITETFGLDIAEVGGTAGMGEAALGAYREMAAAAVALGRSDILYALLLLSVSHAAWFTVDGRERYSAAALLGENSLVGDRTNTVEIRIALRPHIGKLIPRLLRAKHDPNKQTREQMETLWLGLTGGGAEARQAITDHLLPTIDNLIDEGKNKLWRARVGSCGALAEVIVGRSWDDLGGGGAVLEDDEIMLKTSTSQTKAGVRLLRLWRVAMRAIDDVRINVRESGETLARSVRGLTIRLCDPTMTPGISDIVLANDENRQRAEEQSRAAASTSLRWLVKTGLDQQCAEAAGMCVSCLIGIVEVVRPVTLEPVLPELIGSLLMSMSGLEPAALNYLQVRAAGNASADTYDRLEHARLQYAQNGPIAKALNKCLDMIPLVDVNVQQSIIPQLDSALRGGAGFATRASTADCVSTLCNSSPLAFKFPGSSSTNPTVRLLRALYYASERERGIAAKDKMSHALGNLAALSPGQSVRALTLRACERYDTATGNNDDPVARRAAAAAVRSIVVRAPKQVADGGPNDIWCRKVLPVAFLGQKDKDPKISSLWKEVWEEGGSSLGLDGTSGFGALVEERLLPELTSACVRALHDVSWARRVAGATSLYELCGIHVLSPVPRPVNESSMIHGGKGSERASRRAKAASLALQSSLSLLIKPRIWAGKTEVVKTTVKIAAEWALVGDSASALGWMEPDRIVECPWIPLVLGPHVRDSDLFVGDRYFEQLPGDEDLEIDEADLQEKSDKSDDNESTLEEKIDFSEEDQILPEATNSDVYGESTVVGTSSCSVSFKGLCRVLVDHAFPGAGKKFNALSQDEVLPFKAAILTGLTDLLKTVKSSENGKVLEDIYNLVGYRLLSIIDSERIIVNDTDFLKGQPPLIVAKTITAVGALMWNGIGDSDTLMKNSLLLAKTLRNAGGTKQGAWTVREAALKAASDLALACSVASLRKHELVSILLDCSATAMKDLKFWRVRVAGLSLLKSLGSRAGGGGNKVYNMHGSSASSTAAQNQQMILEALLPFKEDILKVARASLKDSQAEVTAVASEICGLLAWWP